MMAALASFVGLQAALIVAAAIVLRPVIGW